MGIDEDGVPIGSPNRIDDRAKSTAEDPLGRPEPKCYTGSNNPDESSPRILALVMSLSQDVENVMGNVDCLRDDIKGNQKDLMHLKEEMSSKMDAGFKRENKLDSKACVKQNRDSKTKKMRDRCSSEHKSGIAIWYICQATATHFSLE